MTAAVRVDGCSCDGCRIVDIKRRSGIVEQVCNCGADAKTFEYHSKVGTVVHSNGYCLACLSRSSEVDHVVGEVLS